MKVDTQRQAFDMLWAGIILLNLWDVVTTTAGLRLAGSHEANPFAAEMAHSPWMFLAYKIVFVAAAWLLMRLGVNASRGTIYATQCWAGTGVILVGYTIVIANNLKVLIP